MARQSIFDFPVSVSNSPDERAQFQSQERQRDEQRLMAAATDFDRFKLETEIARKWGLFQG